MWFISNDDKYFVNDCSALPDNAATEGFKIAQPDQDSKILNPAKEIRSFKSDSINSSESGNQGSQHTTVSFFVALIPL